MINALEQILQQSWQRLGEQVALLQIIGSVLVLTGVLIISLNSKKAGA